MSETTETQAQATLQLQDIQGAVRALDVATENGSWKSWEVYEAVHGIRNRLNNFVEAVAAEEAKNKAAAEAAAATETPSSQTIIND